MKTEGGTKLKLRQTVTRPDGTTLDQLTFSPLTGKDMMDISIGGQDMKMSELLMIASKITGEHMPVFYAMQAPDVLEVVKVVGDFLGGGQKTTKK